VNYCNIPAWRTCCRDVKETKRFDAKAEAEKIWRTIQSVKNENMWKLQKILNEVNHNFTRRRPRF